MDENIPIRHIPHIHFTCVHCGTSVPTWKQLNDGATTIVDCKVCHVEYRVHWGNNPNEIRVELKSV